MEILNIYNKKIKLKKKKKKKNPDGKRNDKRDVPKFRGD